VNRRTALFRLALGPDASGPGTGTLERVASSVPPERVGDLGLAPAVFHHWARSRPSLSPAAAVWLDAIRARVYSDAAAMLPRERGWRVLLGELASRGIPACLLKGSAMRVVGESLPGRTQVDLDLLVTPAHLAGAERFLLDRGYRLRTRYRDREGYLRDHFHLPMIGPEGQVELHWALTRRPPRGAMERIWSRSVPAPGPSPHLRLLSPGDRLLHGCIHVSEHRFSGMARWLVDLGMELARIDAQAWAAFRQEARHWPRRTVEAPLALLALHGVPTPSSGGTGGGDGGATATDSLAVPGASLLAVAFGEGGPGIPASVLERAVGRWLAANGPFPLDLARSWAEGARARLGGEAPEDPRDA
jgi:hypothetical protein